MNVRNPYSFRTLRLATLPTSIGPFIVARVADMANVMDPTARLPESAIGLQLEQVWRVDIARITIRILIQLGWLAGTLLAADMLAVLALLGIGGKGLPTRVTAPPDSLAHSLADEIRPARTRLHLQRGIGVTRQLEVLVERRGAVLSGADLGDLGLGDTRLARRILAVLVRWESWALLAAWVLAVDADLIRAEGCVAAVAGAAHAHADGFGDPCELQIGGRLPLFGLESQAVFGEENARLFLPDEGVVGQHSGLFDHRVWGRGYGWGTGTMCTLAER